MSDNNNDYDNQSFEAEDSNRQPSRAHQSRSQIPPSGSDLSQKNLNQVPSQQQQIQQQQQQLQYNIPQNMSGSAALQSNSKSNMNQSAAPGMLNYNQQQQYLQQQQQQQQQQLDVSGGVIAQENDGTQLTNQTNNGNGMDMDGGMGSMQPTIQDYLISLNQNRQDQSLKDNYIGAELILGQISDIKSDAESRIRQALAQKQDNEKAELEMQHAQEFENFTYQWDMEIKNIQELAQIQIEQLRQKHARELEELRMYLEQSISLQFKPSPELLNLRKVQQHLSKQKNYTEARKVQNVVKELEDKENEKYQAQREEKIRTQLAHMSHKHSLEKEALKKKIDTQLKESDKIRKVKQQELLQRFLNSKNEQNLMQKLELSKLNNQLKIKNYASTIVGKHQGSFQSVSPSKIKS